jgi:hypothetical protein
MLEHIAVLFSGSSVGAQSYSEYIIMSSSVQPLGLFWQEPEPSQATGMALARCISRQVLRGSLPLLSPVFKRSHFCRQMPLRPH